MLFTLVTEQKAKAGGCKPAGGEGTWRRGAECGTRPAPTALGSHGKREVKVLVLTWTLPRPLQTSPGGNIRLRTSGRLPVYNRAQLRGACCLGMGL